MIRVLVVDDEAPARAKVRQLLAIEEDLEVVGEAADGSEAVEMIGRLAPDLVLLDIQMPRLDGFGVIQKIGVDKMPLVVFVTAYDEHALRAFEVHALDYLLKPFAPIRFRRLLARIRHELGRRSSAAPGSDDLSRRMTEMLASLKPTLDPPYLKRIQARLDEDREVLLRVDKVNFIRAHGNYVQLHTTEGEYTRRTTLAALAEKLDPEQFLRINRSEIVRLDAIREIQPWFHGDSRMILHSGEKLSWSRRYRARVKDEF